MLFQFWSRTPTFVTLQFGMFHWHLHWVTSFVVIYVNTGGMKKEVSLWKRIKCFPSTLRRRNLKTQQSAVIQFGFVFEENSVREITWLSWRHRFREAPFKNCFASTRKRKADVFKFLQFKELFKKLCFREELVWTVNLTLEVNLSGGVWTGP